MRKFFYSLIIMLLGSIMPLAAEVRYDLSPVGFEDGAIPSGWTQENVQGSVLWAVEGGSGVTLSSPSGAHQGSYRLAARRASGQTQRFVTRLISPSLDLTRSYQPQLCFSHAQVSSFGLFDTLRVYCRATTADEWVQLAEYVNPIETWVSETIELPSTSRGTTYQVAFEISDNNSKGVVLDDIYVVQPSACEPPMFQMFDVSATSAFIEFASGGSGTGSATDLYDAVVSVSPIDDPSSVQATDAGILLYSTSADSNHVNVGDLTANTKYYIYVRTNCVDNATGYTDWISESFVTPVLVDVPYTENFNSVTGATYGAPYGWTLRTNIDNANVPYVYTGTTLTYLQPYSVDSTSYLGFQAKASVSSVTGIPGGSYAYAATPEINANLSDCEVSFWGTAYESVFDGVTDYASEITIGVMTDPNDMGSFTALKTVNIESAYLFKQFTVSLASYKGNGRYIAFVSNAQKPNAFFIDNVSVYIPSVPTPSVSVRNALPSGFEVVPAFATGADSWNVKVSTSYVRDASVLTESQCLLTQTGLTSGTQVLSDEALLSGKTVLVYVQAVKGGVASAWSFPVTLRVPTRGSVPMEYTFNTGTYSTVALNTLNNEIHYVSTATAWGDVFFPLTSFTNLYPQISTASPTYNEGHLNLNGIDNYFTFPYVESLNSLEMVFRLTVGNTSSSYAGQSRVAVGVMTDPYDLSTFVQLGTYDGGSAGQWTKYYCDFSSYSGNGHYVAVRAIAPAASSTYGSYNAIDNLYLRTIPSCHEVTNVKVESGSISATVHWDAMDMSSWCVRLYSDANTTQLLQKHIASVDSLRLTDLSPETTYYYTVQTICGNDTLGVDDIYSFRTAKGIPYSENFDSYSSLSDISGWEVKQGLASSVFAGQSLSNTYNGWDITSSSGTSYVSYTGNVLMINIWGTSIKYWAISPELFLESNDDKPVRLTFDLSLVPYSKSSSEAQRNNGSDDQFMVVISTDGGTTWKEEDATIWNNKNDLTTDYVYNDIPMRSFQKARVDLSQYIGKTIRIGFYAESQVSNSDNYILIDNVKVSTFDVDCQGLTSLSADVKSSSEVHLSWAAVGNQSLHIDVYEEDSKTAMFSGAVTDNPHVLSDLSSNTAYTVVAYQSCDPQGDTIVTEFRTRCDSQGVDELGTVTFDNAALDLLCWTVGVGDTVGTGSTNLTLPAITSVSKFGNVLYIEKPMNEYGSYYGDYIYGNNYYAIMPELEIDDITQYQVVFKAATNTSSSDNSNVRSLYVGVVSDPADPNLFVPVDTLLLPYASDSLGMRSYTIAFDTYDGDYLGNYGTYIMFQVSAPSNASNVVLIDDVSIEPVQSCHQINDLEATEITDRAVKLVWGGDASEYEVIIADTLCSLDALSTPVYVGRELTSHEVVVSDLHPQTTYYAYVRGICGAGDTSLWSGQTVFKTHFSIPYYENFASNSLGEDWLGYKGSFASNDTLLGSALSPAETGGYFADGWFMQSVPSGLSGMSGTVACVEIYSTGSYDAMLVSPSITLPSSEEETSRIRISFKAAKSAYSYGDNVEEVVDSKDDKFSVVISTDDGETWTRQNSTIWASDGTGYYNYNTFSCTAQRVQVDLTKYAGNSVRIGFFTESKVSAPDTYFYLDSIAVEYYVPTCDGVTGIGASRAGTDSLYLQFAATNMFDTIEYVYGKEQFDLSAAVVHRADANHKAVLSDIDPRATYSIYARTLCADGDTSSWYGPVLSEYIWYDVPFDEDFSTISDKFPAAWSRYAGVPLSGLWSDSISFATPSETSGDWGYSSYNKNALADDAHASVGLYSYYGSRWMLSPVLDLTNEPDTAVLEFSFDAALTYYSNSNAPTATDGQRFFIVVSEDGGATWSKSNTIMWSDEVADSAQYTLSSIPNGTGRNYAFDFSKYVGKVIQIAFGIEATNSNYNRLHIDNISLVNISSCVAAKGLSEKGSSMTTDTLVIIPASGSDVTEWEYAYGEQGTLLSDMPSYIATDSIFVLESLKPSTTYNVYIRSLCNSGDMSVWKGPYSVKTQNGVPYYENFSSNSLDQEWTRYKGSFTANSDTLVPSVSSGGWSVCSVPGGLSGMSGTVARVEIYSSGDFDALLASPSITLTSLDEETLPIRLSFKAAKSAFAYDGSAKEVADSEDDKFSVLISTDDGLTWTRQKSRVWASDGTGYHDYNRFSCTAERVQVDLTEYAGKTVRIGFFTESTISAPDTYFWLDSIAVETYVPTCDGITYISASRAGVVDSMYLRFEATYISDTVEYVYGKDDVDFSTAVPLRADADHKAVLSGIDPRSTYAIYARTLCANGDTSSWYGPAYSEKSLYTVPFAEDFSTIATAFPDSWNRYTDVDPSTLFDGGNFANATKSSTGWKYSSSVGDVLSDDAHAYVSMRSSYDAVTYWMVSPLIDLSNLSDTSGLSFSCDIALTQDGSSVSPASITTDQRVYLAVSTDGGATWSSDYATVWSSLVSSEAQYSMLSIPGGQGAHYEFNFTKYVGKVIQIAFGVYVGGYVVWTDVDENALHVDNIELVSAPLTCESIERISANSYSHALGLSFVFNSITDTVEYVYGLSGSVDLSDAVIYRADLSGRTLVEGLQPSTTYDVYARALCVKGDTTEWYGPVSLTTACLIETPQTYDFDTPGTRYTYASGRTIEECWRVKRSPSADVTIVEDESYFGTTYGYSYSGSSALLFSTSANEPAYVVLPEFDADIDTLQLSFWGRPGYKYDNSYGTNISNAGENYARSIKIGVLSDPYDVSTFEWITTVTADVISTNDDPATEPQGTEYYRKYVVPFAGVSGKYIAFVSDFDKSNYFTIDDVTIERAASCILPINVQAETLSPTSALVRWVSNADSVHVKLVASNGSSMIYTTDADSIVLTGLYPATRYTVSVQNICGSNDVSEWSIVASFTTHATVPYEQDFENTITGWTYASGYLSDVLAGSKTPSVGSSTSWKVGDGATSAEANISGNSAYINIYGSWSYDWFISPLIDMTEADSTQALSLSMTIALSDYYTKTAVDPTKQQDVRFAVVVTTNDGNTWELAALWDNTNDGDYVLNEIPLEGQQYRVDLAKYIGSKIRIALYADAQSYSSNVNLYVDDFVVDYADANCMGVNQLDIVKLTPDSVYAQWTTRGSESVDISIIDPDGTVVYSTTTSDNTLQYGGLASNTWYTLRVAQSCGSDPKEVTFKTKATLPYYEPFTLSPTDWTYATGSLSDIVKGNSFGSASSSWLWEADVNAGKNIHGGALYIGSATSTGNWRISPEIIIPEVDTNKSIMLSLTVALSTRDSNATVEPTAQKQHNFAVVISEDGGSTWQSENVTLWDNQGKGTYVYNEIPVDGAIYKIAMDKYVGKTIKIGLYSETTTSDGDNNLYVDDISINVVEYATYDAETCNSSDYRDTYFTIVASDLVLGTTAYETLVKGANALIADTLYTLSLTVYPAEHVTLYDTICQGSVYTENGFNEPILHSQTLSARYTSSNDCDSLVEIHVEVIPTVYADTTIYACSEYTLNGKTYYSDQILRDTLVSAAGCDSIARISLKISAEDHYASEWRTAICAGDTYSDDVFSGLSSQGTYVETEVTRYGCDSVVTLHLLVADASMSVYDSIELSDLPYIYEGDVILSGALEAGKTYEHDVKASCGTVTLYIHINGEMGIYNASAGNLRLLPNPVRAGEDIQIQLPVLPSDDYVLTVHDALGQTVYTTHAAKPAIPGIPVAGYYVVKIVNDGKVFQTKLLVQ